MDDYFKFAELYLKEKFGIDNLSNIERLHLRKILEQVVSEHEVLEDLLNKAKIDDRTVFNINLEACERWLNNLYGLRMSDFYVLIVKDRFNKKFKYPRYHEDLAIEEFKEIYRTYKDFADNSDTEISIEVKEYVRRLRENSHLI